VDTDQEFPGQPNLLIIMSDEHAPQFSGCHGHPLVQTPHLDRMAAEGVLFEQAYCNSPLCGPSRMSFMTGRYPHQTGCYDNSTALSSDTPTWAHMLRAVGYDVVLSGKQHFVGGDQLHGFRAQLARDLHAEHAHPLFDWSEGTLVATQRWPSIDQAGQGTSTEIEVDDQVEAAARQYLRDPARHDGPWALNVSFIAPHFPFVVPDQYWEMYENADIDLPEIPPEHLETQHPMFQKMRAMFGMDGFSDEEIRRGRIGYYGLISYLDDKIGRLLETLREQDLERDTVVVYLSDHGEMAGEHGMWRKSNFYEHSARVPLVLRWPGQLPAGKRVAEAVSLVDVVATFVDLAGATTPVPLAGESLLPLATSDPGEVDWKDEAFAEYLAHGVDRPKAMLRRGRYKLMYFLDERPELYDLEDDPGEVHNLAGDPAYRPVLNALRDDLLARWDPVAIEQRVRQSQRERLLIGMANSGVSVEEARAQWYASGSTVNV
jgi:choline-sulfatase